MKVAVMQPYLFPYIGYWQLINAVDRFVILDDVNYIMRGYINRNSILVNGKPHRFTIPIEKASQNKLIMDTKLNFDEKEKKKFLATIENAYKKSPCYSKVMPLLEDIILNTEDDLAKYIQYSLEVICNYLKMKTEVYVSSEIEKDHTLHAQERIIEICKKMQADIYINPCGGRSLYNHEAFEKENMKLFFLDTIGENVVYDQGVGKFEKNLSIIDVMMFNEISIIRHFLQEYELNR